MVSLWFSAPTNLNRKVVDSGTKVATYRGTVSSAIELTYNIAFDGAHTPRSVSVRGLYIATEQCSSLWVSAMLETLGGDDIVEVEVQVREQVDSEREKVEVREKEKGDEHEETTNARSNM